MRNHEFGVRRALESCIDGVLAEQDFTVSTDGPCLGDAPGPEQMLFLVVRLEIELDADGGVEPAFPLSFDDPRCRKANHLHATSRGPLHELVRRADGNPFAFHG